jgi:NAD(P)-dependent dehydrogenase (short-subunit alcohol dehydrogenase family)
MDTDPGAFQKTVDVNIRGYFFMSTRACKLMKEKGGGAIVNVASANALRAGLYQGIYSITKAAVLNMTRVFAKECAQFNIRVNTLVPGLTRTRFAKALFEHEEIHKSAIERIPMHRHAEPHEMAGAVLYLVSDAASFTNGEYIVVDGGMMA